MLCSGRASTEPLGRMLTRTFKGLRESERGALCYFTLVDYLNTRGRRHAMQWGNSFFKLKGRNRDGKLWHLHTITASFLLSFFMSNGREGTQELLKRGRNIGTFYATAMDGITCLPFWSVFSLLCWESEVFGKPLDGRGAKELLDTTFFLFFFFKLDGSLSSLFMLTGPSPVL